MHSQREGQRKLGHFISNWIKQVTIILACFYCLGLVRGRSELHFPIFRQAWTSPRLCLYFVVTWNFWLWRLAGLVCANCGGLAQAWYCMYVRGLFILAVWAIGNWLSFVPDFSSETVCSVLGNWNWGLISERRLRSLLWILLSLLRDKFSSMSERYFVRRFSLNGYVTILLVRSSKSI